MSLQNPWLAGEVTATNPQTIAQDTKRFCGRTEAIHCHWLTEIPGRNACNWFFIIFLGPLSVGVTKQRPGRWSTGIHNPDRECWMWLDLGVSLCSRNCHTHFFSCRPGLELNRGGVALSFSMSVLFFYCCWTNHHKLKRHKTIKTSLLFEGGECGKRMKTPTAHGSGPGMGLLDPLLRGSPDWKEGIVLIWGSGAHLAVGRAHFLVALWPTFYFLNSYWLGTVLSS